MTDDHVDLDPTGARTPAEFIDLLRRVRERSGLTYRAIEKITAAAGETLPASTLATLLGRETLPREELVSALLRACGASPDEVAAWVAARQRLAASRPAFGTPVASDRADSTESDVVTTDAGDDPPPAAAAPRRRLSALIAGVALLTVVAAGVVFAIQRSATDPPVTVSGSGSPSAVASDPLAAGLINIRSANSGLCFTERHDLESGEIFQAPCEESFPERSLIPLDGGTYRIGTEHPQFGAGCLGILAGSLRSGAPAADETCGPQRIEEFHLDPVDTPLKGYHIRVLNTQMCMAVLGASRKAWAAVLQLRCDPDDMGQVFTFDRL
ncbi:hypothetical protein F4553_007209 [Allocatelliglobosispora scoriae]|uniref:XRE family transcriptional regulator n=1 Tax=Allocatelliglobosispora scoriae TaxID=643052 RepID=A0A841C1H0_9ACTN|nr:helix-turn-helix domain-containing protein [Allocatelliglobosispora scoriae]MBB5873775.1 hypothetical protein [Allocatelliglobosispora scoriae]